MLHLDVTGLERHPTGAANTHAARLGYVQTELRGRFMNRLTGLDTNAFPGAGELDTV